MDRLDGRPAPVLQGAPLVFAGYGISAPGLGYDDFAEVDVRDAAVVVFTHEPQEDDARSVFHGRNLTPGAAIATKAQEARTTTMSARAVSSRRHRRPRARCTTARTTTPPALRR